MIARNLAPFFKNKYFVQAHTFPSLQFFLNKKKISL